MKNRIKELEDRIKELEMETTNLNLLLGSLS